MILVSDAISSLRPNSSWTLIGNEYENLKWLDTTQPKPTKEEIEAEIDRLNAEYSATQYQRDRAPLYPSLADFADAYYWAQKGDNSKMEEYVAKCDSVKSQYPKPEVTP